QGQPVRVHAEQQADEEEGDRRDAQRAAEDDQGQGPTVHVELGLVDLDAGLGERGEEEQLQGQGVRAVLRPPEDRHGDLREHHAEGDHRHEDRREETRGKRVTCFAMPYDTGREARYSFFRAARMEASVIWKHVCDVVWTTAMRTRAGRICKTAMSLLTVSTTRERTSPTTDASPPPTRRIRHMSARGRLARGA